MRKTLTVKELIDQLQKVDENLPLYICGLGLTSKDTWEAPLEFEEITVGVQKGKCFIMMSAVG